jgi:hypothetical protein
MSNCYFPTTTDLVFFFSPFPKCKIRIHRFTWRFDILVADILLIPVILGSDFIVKTGLMLDLRHDHFFFHFPQDKIRLCGRFSHVSPFYSLPCCPALDGDPLAQPDIADLSHLTSEQADSIRQVIHDFPDIFTSKLGLINVLQYHIELKDRTPVRLPPYRLSSPKMHIMREHVQDMLQKGIIRHFVSQYSSPIFLVPKGESDFRRVVDYRVLNAKLKIESVPLPDIHS